MIIENIDALKVWLIKTLGPICDADPVALAKYVVALAKKDKPLPELKALCEDQLDVFLGDETKDFVTELFNTLVSKSYMVLTPQKKIESSIKQHDEESELKGTKRKSFEDGIMPEKNAECDKVQKTESKVDVGKVKTVESDKENVNEKKIDRSKVVDNDRKKDIGYHSDMENQPKLYEKVDNDKPLRMLTRQSIREENKFKQDVDNISMRSVSQDRSVKSLSPVPMKTRHGHSSRKKASRSPSRTTRHTRSSKSKRRDHDRNRDKRSSGGRRDKEKCRDYEEKGFCMLGEVCPYDHGYDPVEVDDKNLPQMLTLAGIPAASQANAQIPGAQLQMIPNVLPSRPIVPLSSGLSLNTGLTTVQVRNARPIPSPAELPNHQVPIFRPRNPMAFMRNLSPSAVPPVMNQQVIRSPAVGPAKTTDDLPKLLNTAYNPEDPSIEVGVANTLKVAMKTQSLPSAVSNQAIETKLKEPEGDKSSAEDTNKTQDEDNRTQDELVQIAMGNVPLTPIVGSQPNWNGDLANNSQPRQLQPSVTPQPQIQNQALPHMMQPTYLPMTLTVQQQYHQLQVQQHQAALASQQQLQGVNPALVPFKPYRKNSILELRKIPTELNNILRLSEYFQKFGNVIKVQTPYDNDPQAALLEFSSYVEATSAYSSPEAILGNRFIKMFWHNAGRPKLPTISASPTVKQLTGAPQDSSRLTDVGRSRKIATSAQLTYINPKTDPKMIQIEKKRELEKCKMELIRIKQNHYEELAKRQKEILSKLQGSGLTKEEKERLKKAFKHADVACQKLKKELLDHTQVTKAVISSPAVLKTADTKKAILDKEIDIYHGNLCGEELIEAKRSLAALKREANFSRPLAPRGRGGFRGRGRGSWHRGGHVDHVSGRGFHGGSHRGHVAGSGRGRGRGRGIYQINNIDNRPKQILVSGYDIEEKDDVVAHFASFAQVDRIEEHENNKMILTFPTRKSADIAAQQGIDFKGKSLILSWFTGERKVNPLPQPPQMERQMTRSLSQSLMDKDLDDDLLELDKEEEEMLLADVEDDDDDDDIESEERSWRR